MKRIFAIIAILVVHLASGDWSAVSAQPLPGIRQTEEPPLADESIPVRRTGNNRTDAEDSDVVKQADFSVSTPVPIVPKAAPPVTLPSSVTTPLAPTMSNPIQPVVYGEAVGEIPTPQVTLQIEGSEVSPTGQEVAYRLHVRNVSRARAHNVQVRVKPPKGATKVKAEPPATADEAETRWEFKTLEAGAHRVIELAYKPGAESEKLRLEARIQYGFGRYMETEIAVPGLSVTAEQTDKRESAVIGDTVGYRITIKNTGKTAVKDVEVGALLPQGMVLAERETTRGTVDGRLMSTFDPRKGEGYWTIPVIAPGRTETLTYRAKAKTLGPMRTMINVKAPGLTVKPAGIDTEVLSASLQITAEGPAADKGTVGQKAGFRAVVINKGSAELKNVCVRCVFPPDMRVVRATENGQPFRDTVQWMIASLPPGQQKEFNVALITTTPGERSIDFIAKADKGDDSRTKVKAVFDGEPGPTWDTDVPGTAGVGQIITYKMTLSNTGTAAARGMSVEIDLPRNVELISVPKGSRTGNGENANLVILPPVDVEPNKKVTLLVDVRARTAGESRVIFRLKAPGLFADAPEHRKMTMITGDDRRNPSGPPPRTTPLNVTSNPRP